MTLTRRARWPPPRSSRRICSRSGSRSRSSRSQRTRSFARPRSPVRRSTSRSAPGRPTSSIGTSTSTPSSTGRHHRGQLRHFDVPKFNALMEHADRLNGDERYRTYGRLDVQLARDAAPMIVVGFDNERNPGLETRRLRAPARLRPRPDGRLPEVAPLRRLHGHPDVAVAERDPRGSIPYRDRVHDPSLRGIDARDGSAALRYPDRAVANEMARACRGRLRSWRWRMRPRRSVSLCRHRCWRPRSPRHRMRSPPAPRRPEAW